MSAVLDDKGPSTPPRHSIRAGTAASAMRPAPAPIRFPSRTNVEELCRTRANADNERWRKQAEQRGTLIASAHAEGYDQGERAGYVMGWHWGLVAGIAVGGVAIGLLWAGWDAVQGWLA